MNPIFVFNLTLCTTDLPGFRYLIVLFAGKKNKKTKNETTKICTAIYIIIGFTNCNKNDDPVIEVTLKVVINELLPKNTQYGSDQDGEFVDWIELYNPANEDHDI